MTGPAPTVIPPGQTAVPAAAIVAGTAIVSVQFDGTSLTLASQRWSVLHDLSFDGVAWATDATDDVTKALYAPFPTASEFQGGALGKTGLPLPVYWHATTLPASAPATSQHRATVTVGPTPLPTTVQLVSHAASGAVVV